MQVIYERCAAIDVHKKTAVTTVMITQADGKVQEQTQTFSTMTSDLLALDDWLRRHQVEVIAMESTGVFWRPIFNLLEGAIRSPQTEQSGDGRQRPTFDNYLSDAG